MACWRENRSVGSWLTLAIFFGFLATAFLMAAPVTPDTERNIEPTSIEDFGKTPKDNEADELRNDQLYYENKLL